MTQTHFFGFQKLKWSLAEIRLRAYQVLQPANLANLIETTSASRSSTSPNGTAPISSGTGSRGNSQSPQKITTPVTTPSKQKVDPFADLFSNDDSLQTMSTEVADLSAFLTSSPPSMVSNTIATEHQQFEEDQTEDSYFNFFLSELPKSFPYVNLFPWTAATLFSTSNHNPALRQSVLAVAALIADQKSRVPGEALKRLQIALQSLRNRIQVHKGVDDGMVISSFLLAHFSMMLGDHATAKKHLRGMSSFLSRLNHSRGLHQDLTPSPLTTDKLTILIWRMAIRIDFISSITCGREPVLPMS